ncbi:MAG: TraB/GumN family protein, partial [Gammaproteobacteria bacterium]
MIIFNMLYAALRRLCVACVVLIALAVSASPCLMAAVCDTAMPGSIRNNSLLWQIQRAGEPVSYLFGTLHVEGPWVELLIEDMQPVFESTQSLLVELEMDALTQLDLAQSMLLPDPYRLTDFFSEAEFQQIVRLMRGRIEGARLKVVKPWVVFVQLYSARSDAEQTMDMLIAHNYHQLKKPVKGLESVSRQLSVFDALSYQQQAALVRRALEIYQVQSATLNQRLFQYYRRGDLINLWVLQEQFVEDM